MTHLNQEVALTIKLEGEAFASWDGLDDAVTRRIADHFISDHSMRLRERVNAIVDERVTEVVNDRVEAFLSRPIPPLDRFGMPIAGASTRSLADIVADAADAVMIETVDAYGKPQKKDAYNNALTRLEWLVKRVAIVGIAAAVEKAVKEVNAAALAQVKAQVAAEIAARMVAK